jgi:hypothetical protein
MADTLGRINKIRKDRHPKNFQISAFNHRSVYVGLFSVYNFDASSRIQSVTFLCIRCLKAALKVL